MSGFDCPNCHVEMPFDHTDYYDFDVYKCPKCGHMVHMAQDDYLDEEGLRALYGDEYFEDVDWSDGEE